MLPFWTQLSLPELLQGTGFVGMAVILFTLQFLMPSRRA